MHFYKFITEHSAPNKPKSIRFFTYFSHIFLSYALCIVHARIIHFYINLMCCKIWMFEWSGPGLCVCVCLAFWMESNWMWQKDPNLFFFFVRVRLITLDSQAKWALLDRIAHWLDIINSITQFVCRCQSIKTNSQFNLEPKRLYQFNK